MKKAPFESDVSSPRGAPMGRPSDPLESFQGKLHLRAVPFVDGDYDKGGAYWGENGTPLFCVWNGEGVAYFRAPNRSAAKGYILATTCASGSLVSFYR